MHAKLRKLANKNLNTPKTKGGNNETEFCSKTRNYIETLSLSTIKIAIRVIEV